MDGFKITLKAARVNSGLTQQEAASSIGINKNTLIKWEQGKTSPDGLKLIALCELYHIPLNNIFLRSENTLSVLDVSKST